MHTTPKAVSLAIVSVLLLASSAYPQKFKGHQIGESASDFLSVEPVLKAKFTGCQTNPPRELTPEEIKARYGSKALKEYQNKKAREDNSTEHVAIMDKDPDVYGDKCGALLDALVAGHGHFDGNGYDITNPYSSRLSSRALSESNIQLMPQHQMDIANRWFVFEGGVLVSLAMNVQADYESTRDDVTSRLGSAPTETHIPFQNGFGAQWNEQIAVWDGSRLYVELSQDHNPVKPSLPRLGVEDAEWRKQHQVTAPKPLD